jgi:hypothetical protein
MKRHGTACIPGAGAARHEGDAVDSARADDASDFAGTGGDCHGVRRTAALQRVDAVGDPRLVVETEVRFADDRSEVLEKILREHYRPDIMPRR